MIFAESQMTNEEQVIQYLRGIEGENIEYSEEDLVNLSIKQTADSEMQLVNVHLEAPLLYYLKDKKHIYKLIQGGGTTFVQMPDPEYEHFTTVRHNEEYMGLILIDPLLKYFIKKYKVTKFDFVLPNVIRLSKSASMVFDEYCKDMRSSSLDGFPF